MRALLEAGRAVTGIVRPGTPRPRLADLEQEVELLEVDVLVEGALADAVDRVRPDLAVNLVVTRGHPTASADRIAQLAVGLLGTARLVEALARVGCGRLVHLGSSLEYGPGDRPHREDDAPAPVTSRGVAKAAETVLCLGSARALGLSAIVLRPFSVYGPWDHERRLVPTAIRAALDEGAELRLTEPGYVHDFVHVSDVVRAIELASCAPDDLAGKVFNVGTGLQTTNEGVVELVGKAAGRRILATPGTYPTQPHDRRVWLADVERASTELGWTPSVTLEEGVASTYAWYASRAHAVAW